MLDPESMHPPSGNILIMLGAAVKRADCFLAVTQIHLIYANDLLFSLVTGKIQGKRKEGTNILIKRSWIIY